MNPSTSKSAKRVRIYINESDQTGTFPSPTRLLEFLRKRNAAGATVLRGGAGFGASGRIHTANIVDLATDLPVIVEWVDCEERIEQLLPELLSMVIPGLVTVEDVVVALCAPHPVRDVSSELSVAAVMTREPTCVSPDTTAREVVERMREHRLRGIPVVDNSIPVGMITSSDLVARAGLGVSMSLVPGLEPLEISHALDRIYGVIARDIMIAPAVVVQGNLPLTQAATLMVMHRLKRLPVVDERGALMGIVSRVDLLRTVTDCPEREQPTKSELSSDSHVRLDKIMRCEVPTLFPHASIAEVVQAVISTRLNRALVVDANRRVVGIVSAVELLQRITPSLRSRTLAALMHRLPFLHQNPQDAEFERHARAHNADDLMSKEFMTAKPDTTLREVIDAMVEGRHKLVAVVDEKQQLMGVVDRADVLRGMLCMG